MSKKQKNIKVIKRKRQPKKVNEIRTNYGPGGQGHPTYIYKKEGGKFHFIGLTHAKITDRTRNIPLDVNPDPSDLRKTYARPFKESDKAKNFGSKHKGWKLSPRDKKKLKKNKKR